MSALFRLDGKLALITGASRGLGLAMAHALAQHGAHVHLNGRDLTTLTQATTKLRTEGLLADALPFDVTDADGATAAVAALPRLDILVSNAGLQHREPLASWTDHDFTRLIDTHLVASFRLARLAAARMMAQGHGRIIMTGSVGAILGRPTIHGYIAAKAALHGLTRSLAAELGRHGITVNALAPGYFATELNEALLADPEFSAWIERRVPVGRWARPDELAGAVVFLASDAAAYVNGHVLAVDGGLSVSL